MDCGIQAKKRRNRIFKIRDGWGTMKRMIRYGVTDGVDLKLGPGWNWGDEMT